MEERPLGGPVAHDSNELLNVGRERAVFLSLCDAIDVQHCIPTQVRRSDGIR